MHNLLPFSLVLERESLFPIYSNYFFYFHTHRVVPFLCKVPSAPYFFLIFCRIYYLSLDVIPCVIKVHLLSYIANIVNALLNFQFTLLYLSVLLSLSQFILGSCFCFFPLVITNIIQITLEMSSTLFILLTNISLMENWWLTTGGASSQFCLIFSVNTFIIGYNITKHLSLNLKS